jgi:hypothetical protein
LCAAYPEAIPGSDGVVSHSWCQVFNPRLAALHVRIVDQIGILRGVSAIRMMPPY